jgi:hypothetical protein
MTIVFWLVLGAFMLVVASLVGGVVSMVHGGESDDKHATHYMIARVGFQALAVMLLILLAFVLYE